MYEIQAEFGRLKKDAVTWVVIDTKSGKNIAFCHDKATAEYLAKLLNKGEKK